MEVILFLDGPTITGIATIYWKFIRLRPFLFTSKTFEDKYGAPVEIYLRGKTEALA
jgi:hypothetical protein